MTKRGKKESSINKELAAIASLRDSDIDTSDIAEITNWSQAVVGRFYSVQRTSLTRPASSDAAFTPRPLPVPIPVPQLSTGIAVAAMTEQQLVLECIQGGAEAWDEFLRRWHKLIAQVIARAAREWGGASWEATEDLVQDVYLRLAANDFEFLRRFQSRHENAFAGFLKMVTASVAYDHFRAMAVDKRGGAQDSTSIELTSTIRYESIDSFAEIDRIIFLAEIDEILKTAASDRDRTIFRLYYLGGLSSKEIAGIPEFKLTVKGVESVIFRLTKLVRDELAQAAPAPQSQRGTPAFKKKDQ